MPVYIIKAPNGQDVEMTADKPPTEEQKTAVFREAGLLPPSSVPSVSALDMLSGKVGRDTGADMPAPDWKSHLAGALEPMAHPQTAGDFAALAIPSGGVSLGGVGDVTKELAERGYNALKTAGAETTGVRGALSLPVRAFQKFKDALPSVTAAESEKFLGPTRGAPYTPAAPTINAGVDIVDRNMPAIAPAAPKLAITATDFTRIKALVSQGISERDAVRTVLNLKAKGL